jgi:hypothetical protein
MPADRAIQTSRTSTQVQAKRMSRLAVFVYGATPVGVLAMTLAGTLAFTIIVVLEDVERSTWALCGRLLATLCVCALQLFTVTKVASYTTLLRPRVAGEVQTLLLFFLLFAVALVQLYMSPVISGNADSETDWDDYHVSLELIQGIAGILSVISALIAIFFSFAPFTRNSDDLSVRLLCATITLCPYQQPTCHCTEQAALW